MSKILSFICIFSFSSILFAQSADHYHLLKKYDLGGEGGWDYVAFDETQGRVFIAHATHVVVFDTAAEKVVGDIPNTIGVHGIALAPEFNHGFVSCGRMNSVLMFNMKTLDTLKRIPVKENPDAIIYDPFSKSVITCDGHSECASVIDAETGEVKTTIQLGGSPEFAVSDGNGQVYINLEDKSQVVDIDIKKGKVLHHWSLGEGEGPTGLAIDKKAHRLFSGCANEKMVILNADDGKIITTFPIGKHVDAVVFDAEKKVAISSNGEGNLTVVHEVALDKYEFVENVVTQAGARTEALNPKTHDLYLITADFGAAPAPTQEHPHPRPSIIPNTFRLLKYGY
ncbi:MAG TPA: YncE family protein [Candidatus Kapabacteria bacterium]|nr:YncE family protein [Candidatus Kapabacteria bacterium]